MRSREIEYVAFPFLANYWRIMENWHLDPWQHTFEKNSQLDLWQRPTGEKLPKYRI
jgi:hypothetical protein